MDDDCVIFLGLEIKISSSNFQGGSIKALFGGAKLDLRDAKFDKLGGNLG
jgi:hypothetical protein